MEALGFAYLAAGIGAAALESIGRQPEMAGQLRTTMIIAAALVEGVAFFAAVICLLLVLK